MTEAGEDRTPPFTGGDPTRALLHNAKLVCQEEKRSGRTSVPWPVLAGLRLQLHLS